jgi:ArsR family transcriptional regulator, arsenate/arsenite/antimonite-responsive transcriptional repressor
MESKTVVKALAALAQSSRLEIFRTLVVAGETGQTPGVLAEVLGVTPNTLSFHRMNAVLAYLTQNCCQGQPCLTDAATTCDC